MSKPRRNDPCPCGSGKKYKRCCGKEDGVALTSAIYKEELDQLQLELLDFATLHYQKELVDLIYSSATEYMDTTNKEEIQVYTNLLEAWGIFNMPVEQDKTIFDLFYEQTQQKINRPAVQEAFTDWNNNHSSVFEISLIGDAAHLTDLLTKEVFHASFRPDIDYIDGDLMVGLLVPYVNSHEFFYFASHHSRDLTNQITALMKQMIPSNSSMRVKFPEFIGQLLQLENKPSLTWDNADHEQVANLFENHARKKNYEEDLISLTLNFWSDFCAFDQPKIYKAAGHAAALDYFSQIILAPTTDATQASLAKEYATSPGTISKHFRKMDADFNLILEKKSKAR